MRNHPRKRIVFCGSAAVLAAAASMLFPASDTTRRGTSDMPSATGSVHGSVRIGPNLGGRRVRISLYPDASRQPAPAEPRSPANELTNVVVYLQSDPALTAATASVSRSGPFRMEQSGESFVPHVLPVVTGTTVDFPNGDPIFHNVFSLSRASTFDLGRYPKGSSRSVRFDKPGIVKVFCHIHSDMSAVVLVLDNAFFASPDASGEYEIDRIPPGRYVAVGWHERARPIHREFTVEPGGRTQVDLAIPLEDEPVGQ